MSENKFSNKASAKIGGGLTFVNPADLSRAEFTGVLVEGKFVETVQNPFNETKNDIKIVADSDSTIKGITSKGEEYEKNISSGDTVVLNSAGNLEYLMEQVGLGELCRVHYLGKTEIKSGTMKGKEAHNYEVEY